MASTIDTLEIARDLRASDFSEKQAEGLARALRKAREHDLAELVTKPDLALLRAELIGGMTELRGAIDKLGAELRGAIDKQGAELRGEIDKHGAELKGEIDKQGAALKGEIDKQGAELRGEIDKQGAELRGDLDTKFADLKGEVARSKNGLLMWLLPLLFGQVGALVLLILRTP